jgi:hypothetical protein
VCNSHCLNKVENSLTWIDEQIIDSSQKSIRIKRQILLLEREREALIFFFLFFFFIIKYTGGIQERQLRRRRKQYKEIVITNP